MNAVDKTWNLLSFDERAEVLACLVRAIATETGWADDEGMQELLAALPEQPSPGFARGFAVLDARKDAPRDPALDAIRRLVGDREAVAEGRFFEKVRGAIAIAARKELAELSGRERAELDLGLARCIDPVLAKAWRDPTAMPIRLIALIDAAIDRGAALYLSLSFAQATYLVRFDGASYDGRIASLIDATQDVVGSQAPSAARVAAMNRRRADVSRLVMDLRAVAEEEDGGYLFDERGWQAASMAVALAEAASLAARRMDAADETRFWRELGAVWMYGAVLTSARTLDRGVRERPAAAWIREKVRTPSLVATLRAQVPERRANPRRKRSRR